MRYFRPHLATAAIALCLTPTIGLSARLDFAKESPLLKAPQAPPAAAPSNGRALPSPLPSPPFPGSDWLGFPLIGAPYSASPSYPLSNAQLRTS
ncbi:MAG: hypothetical protein JSS72_06855 [Armatimonadetes bacterium]|nr:hypothetical protein [Armatimonadota bacterium]